MVFDYGKVVVSNEREVVNMKKILHDDYGNRAEIEEVATFPYKGSPKKEKSYKLSLCAEYDNDFLYFVSLYESEYDAMRKLENFSCNTWK